MSTSFRLARSAPLLLALSAILTQCLAVVTTGASGSGTRLEVRTLQQDADAWNVYLLGASAMQNTSQSTTTSYYQIAGIHGYPAVNYDGVTGVSDPSYPGYCPHRSNYFPTWHRPYIALFEQVLQQNAIAQINKFPSGATKTKYLAKANSLKSPYWDWTQTSGGSAFPSLLTDATVKVTMAVNGKIVTTTIPNPLLAYKYNPSPGDLGGNPFNTWKQTLRSPTSFTSSKATSQEDVSRSSVDNDSEQLKERLYKVLTTYKTYNTVSNEAWITAPPDQQDSLESIHDNIHTDVGGASGPGGHMYYLAVSAYDPSFWLHHTMVDRSFALWQALNPKAWFQGQQQQGGTWWFDQGITSKSTDGLKPFKKDASGTMWTSDTVRDWTVFNYTYPELPKGYTAASVRAAIDKLYGSTTSIKAAPQATKPQSRIRRFAAGAGGWPGHWGQRKSTTKDTEGMNDYEYFINIRANKYALLKPYAVHAFLGDAGEPSSWRTSGNYVGYQGVPGRLLTEPKAADLGPAYIAGTIPLNRALQKKIDSGELKHTTSADIDDYLQKNLNWKAMASDGTVYDAKDVPGLLVSVGQTVYQNAPASDSGVISTASANTQAEADKIFKNKISSILSHITEGKANGLGAGQLHYYQGAGGNNN